MPGGLRVSDEHLMEASLVEKTIRHCVVTEDGRTRLEPRYVERLRVLVSPILDRYPVRRAWLYGSVARGVYRSDSDIDIILDQPEGARLSFGDLNEIQSALEDVLGVDVDVFTLCRPRARKAFLANFDRDRVSIYECTRQ